MGIELKEQYLYTLQFADDQAVISNDEKNIEYIVKKLIKEYEKWGLRVNTQKTKYLCIGAKTENLIMEGNKELTRNKYLGIREIENR